ncbi:hypothetical protein T11_8561 [Trichinella zimbabwensis]|uniref:Uncharacterized protein n=1 Tax=Trichinella zimbabwensis TaxID=268475 RepID=A0A0V1HR09_9BILA|nr:hypothetical protein T11_8561 [Trichinella zimbabwensis]
MYSLQFWFSCWCSISIVLIDIFGYHCLVYITLVTIAIGNSATPRTDESIDVSQARTELRV